MASSKGFARIVLMTSLALCSLLILPQGWMAANAQPPATPRPRTRTLLSGGIESYRQGNYEEADALLRQAQAGVSELNDSERMDLDSYLARNNADLQARRDGVALLRQLEQALQENRQQDAAEIAKALTIKRDYLAASDRDKCSQLLERTRIPGGIGRPTPGAGSGSMPEGAGAATLARAKLQQARALLAQGRFDAADQLAQDVQAMKVTFSPNEDNPRKLREDVTADRKDARFLLTAARTAFKSNDLDRAEYLANQASENAGIGGFLFGDSPSKLQKEIQEARKKGVSAPNPPVVPPGGQGNEVGGRTPAGPAGSGELAARQSAAAAEAFKMMQVARQALQDGNTAGAEKMATTVKELNPDMRGWPENLKPDSVLAEIHGSGHATAVAHPGQGSSTATSMKPATSSTAAPAGSATQEDPHALVKQAKDAFDAGKFDEATALATRARAADSKNTKWSLFEDTPNSMLTKISKARAKQEKDDSSNVLAEARRHFESGDLDNAKKLAYQAQKMHGDYAWWETGDRPARLLDEIHTAETKKQTTKAPAPPAPPAEVTHKPPVSTPPAPDSRNALPPPRGSQVVHNPPAPSAGSGSMQIPTGSMGSGYVPASVTAALKGSGSGSGSGSPVHPPVTAADVRMPPQGSVPLPATDPQKQHGHKLVQEGKMLESQGRLIEAKTCFDDARRFMGPPAQKEPDEAGEAIIALRSVAYRDVNRTVDGVADAAKEASRDPSRYQKIQSDLARARQIAAAFQLDVAMVDQKIAWVQAVQSGAKAPEPEFIPQMTTGTAQGQELIRQGYRAFRSGKLAEAKKLAREAFDPTCGVQQYAKDLSKRIDDEELNQKRLAENRSFDAGVEKYNQKDFIGARMILEHVNERMLDMARQQSYKEILNSPEMHAAVVQATGFGPAGSAGSGSPGIPGVARATDIDLPPSSVMQNEMLKKTQMMQDLKFQKLQAESRRVQSQAIQLSREGDNERALEVLKELSVELGQSELSPDKVATLRRPVEHRIQEFNTIKAQVELEKTRKQGDVIEYGDRSQHELAKKLKEKKVAELMSQFETFYRDHKYADAERVASLAADLDPDNPACQAAYQMAHMQVRLELDKDLNRRKEDFDNKALLTVEDLGTLPNDKNPMVFDGDQKERMKLRPGLDKGISLESKSPVEKEIEHRLYSPVNLKFIDTPLDKVLDDLRHWQGINVILDLDALNEMGINPKQLLTFEIGNGASLKSALELMLGQLKLTWVVKNDALVITTEQRSQGKTTQRVFPVGDLVTPRPNTAGPPSVVPGLSAFNPDVKDNGPTPYVSPGGISTGTPVGAATPGLSSRPEWRQKPVENTIQNELIRLITHTIQSHSWAEQGGHGTIDYFPLGMALVVNQTPNILDEVDNLLQALRRLQDVEVSVEMRIVSVADNFFERIGVDFSANIKTDKLTTKYENQLLSGQFKPAGFVNDFSPKGFVAGLQRGGAFTTDLDIPIQTNSFAATPVPAIAFQGGNPIGGLDVGLAFLSDIQLFMFLEAIQYDQRNHIMQAPKLMMFNGQQATLNVGSQQLLVTGLNVQSLNGHVVASPQITAAPGGGGNITLNIVPIVSADRRFVRLDIDQTMTNISPIIPFFPITQTLFNQIVEIGQPIQPPLVFTNFLQQPTTDTLFVRTSVNVPDGGTVVMGGFKRLAEGRNEAGPPILSKIPYVSRLFRNVSYGRSSEHLIMLVTPRVIITEEEERKATGIGLEAIGGGQ